VIFVSKSHATLVARTLPIHRQYLFAQGAAAISMTVMTTGISWVSNGVSVVSTEREELLSMIPTNIKDMIGMRFGRLAVVTRVESDKRGEARWLCLCDCGENTTVLGSHLRTGRIKSCGCYMRERTSERMRGNTTKGNTRHGGSKTRLYRIWTNMKTRCFNHGNKLYRWYGALGVTVCREWLDYALFEQWALSNGYDDNLTIERVNPHGNYEPSNCTWIPLRDQNKNKRSHPAHETDQR
jgi:hypothetical protein